MTPPQVVPLAELARLSVRRDVGAVIGVVEQHREVRPLECSRFLMGADMGVQRGMTTGEPPAGAVRVTVRLAGQIPDVGRTRRVTLEIPCLRVGDGEATTIVMADRMLQAFDACGPFERNRKVPRICHARRIPHGL